MPQALPVKNPFVGRELEQQRYHQFLAKSSPWVMMVIGQGGIGKSTLLQYLVDQTPEDTLVARINFAVLSLRSDPLTILEELAVQIASYCHPDEANSFELALHMGREKLSRVGGDLRQEIHLGDNNTFLGQGMQLNINAAVQEQRREVRKQITGTLYALMLTLKRKRLVLMLDTCEWLSEPEGQEVAEWVLNDLLPEVHERLRRKQYQYFALLASRVRLSMSAIERQDQYIMPLSMLDKTSVDDYLIQVGMQDAELHQHIYEITHGHALCVSIIGTLWQERGEHPFTRADLPKLQEQFNERALLEFIQERLDQRLKSPFRELTRYGVLLRGFDLPMLRAVFPEQFPEAEALDRFHQLIRYPYIESRGERRYAFHDLLRELQAGHVREQEPEVWRRYHQRALDYLAKTAPDSPDRYYHAIACNLEEGITEWWRAVQDAQIRGEREYIGALLQTVFDGTLQLTPITQAACAFQQGRYYYFIRQMDAALQSYERALTLYLDLGERMGEANVRKAIGDVQRFRRDMDASMHNYEQALVLHRQVGDRLGEANDLKAIGDVQSFRQENKLALQSYQQSLLLYRSVGNLIGQANALRVLGDTYQRSQELNIARDTYRQSLALYKELGSKLGAANVLESLHKILQVLDEQDEAERCHQQAVILYRQMNVDMGDERNQLGTIAQGIVLPSNVGGVAQSGGDALEDATMIAHIASLPKSEMWMSLPETPRRQPLPPTPAAAPATFPPYHPPDTPESYFIASEKNVSRLQQQPMSPGSGASSHQFYPYIGQQPYSTTLPTGNIPSSEPYGSYASPSPAQDVTLPTGNASSSNPYYSNPYAPSPQDVTLPKDNPKRKKSLGERLSRLWRRS